MALYRSVYGLRQEMAPIPFQAGDIITADFTYSFETVGLLTTDKLELGVLPSGAKIVEPIQQLPISRADSATRSMPTAAPAAGRRRTPWPPSATAGSWATGPSSAM